MNIFTGSAYINVSNVSLQPHRTQPIRQVKVHYEKCHWKYPMGLRYITWNVFNSSPSGQSDHHVADEILKCIFRNENFCTSIQISLKLVSKRPINYNTSSTLFGNHVWNYSGYVSLA